MLNDDGSFLNALVMAVMVAVLTVAIAAAPLPPDQGTAEQVAVVFAPWTSAEDSYLRTVAAGGRPVRSGGFDSVIVAVIDTPATVRALRQHGAWLLLNPLLLGGCSDSTSIQNAFNAP